MKKRASRGGFSLVEIVFSIAILALTSLFVLQVFLKAVNLEDKAKSYDNALAEVQSAVETFKIYGTLDPARLPEHIYEEGLYTETKGETFLLTLGYDGRFAPLALENAAESAAETSSATYLLTVEGEYLASGMCVLRLAAVRTSGYYMEDDEPQELFSLETEVFAGSGVGR